MSIFYHYIYVFFFLNEIIFEYEKLLITRKSHMSVKRHERSTLEIERCVYPTNNVQIRKPENIIYYSSPLFNVLPIYISRVNRRK